MDIYLNNIKKAKTTSMWAFVMFLVSFISNMSLSFIYKVQDQKILGTLLKVWDLLFSVIALVLLIVLIVKSFSLASKKNNDHFRKMGWILIFFLFFRVAWGFTSAGLKLSDSDIIYSNDFKILTVVVFVMASTPYTISVIFFHHKCKEYEKESPKKLEEELDTNNNSKD